MNWADLAVIGIIAIFAVIGLARGFIFSIFKIFSFFISIILAVKFYPVLADILLKTKIYETIKSSIHNNLVSKIGEGVKNSIPDIVNSLPVPDFLKNILISDSTSVAGADTAQMTEIVSGELAKFVINILSLIILYILIRIGLLLLKFLLEGLAKLPVFKQMDKVGGLAFGAVEGLLTIYILGAILMLFNSAPQFQAVFDDIDKSLVAKFFYENNFIIDMMFPGR